jgi:hypothetical protein
MKQFFTLTETETGGVKTYVNGRSGFLVSLGEQTRAVDDGGAFVNVTTLFFTTGFKLLDGSFVRIDGRVYRVASNGLHGMAGLKRYEGTEVDA